MTSASRKNRIEPLKETDESLLLSGRPEAFEALLRRHQAKLFAVACRLMRDRDLAGELLQESLYRAYKNRARYQGSGTVAGWLTRITVNTCLNELKKRQRLVFSEDALESWSQSEDPAHQFESRERRSEVRREMEKLSPLRLAIVSLCALGYSYEEIAEATEQSVSQVKSELFRARKKLREGLLKTP
jgi:RNA polymerase sigma-70 factor (ECF subfamily)